MNLQSLELNAPKLFQEASTQYLFPEQAVEIIGQHPGIIPVAITPTQQIIWLDVGGDPFKEWKFRHTIQNLMKHQKDSICFTTDLKVLTMMDSILQDSLAPEGFVFHASKCGSTLMSKALTQPERHLVISEATPLHENFWQVLTNDWHDAVELTDENLAMVRNLILAMGRRRRPNYAHYFVRFRSWNVAFAQVIQHAFPDTPRLFMYRNPMEILTSILNKPTTGLPRLIDSGAAAFITGHSTEQLKDMDALHYFTSFYKQYMQLGLTQMQHNTRHLNYQQLTKQNLPHILQHSFGYTSTGDNLALMQAQFDTYSKDNGGKTRFSSDTREKQKLITPAIRQISEQHLMQGYRALDESDLNLNRVLPT